MFELDGWMDEWKAPTHFIDAVYFEILHSSYVLQLAATAVLHITFMSSLLHLLLMELPFDK